MGIKKRADKISKNVPIAQVTGELFCQWADDVYYPESKQFQMAFNEKEREILAHFDETLNFIIENMPDELPDIFEFVKSKEWEIVNQAAIDTLRKKAKVI